MIIQIMTFVGSPWAFFTAKLNMGKMLEHTILGVVFEFWLEN